MLKRMLVLLGETASSVSARQYAFRLARTLDIELAGLAGIDLSFIEAPVLGGIGVSAYQVRLEEQLKQQAEDARQRLRANFEEECRRHDVRFEWMSFEGDPVGSLYSASETRDLVVTGHDTAFRGAVHQNPSDLLAKLLLVTPRPVIVCPDELAEGDEILIAYDGSAAAMRAVQMFALLGLGRGKRICVTSIDESQELAARRTGGAAAYLHGHGYEVEMNPMTSRMNPAEVLGIEVADRKIGTMVMGAYGHRGFREILFGSTTGSLVAKPPCAIFLYH